MSLIVLMSMLALSQASTGQTSLCAISAGEIPVGTPVVIGGRFMSDFMHFNGATNEDGSCPVPWSFAPGIEATPLGKSFGEATWKRRQTFPDTAQTAFIVKASGEVRRYDDGRYFVWVTTLDALTIDGEVQ